ncbi:MAG: multidrug efflux SMR transporter [Rickettsia endosymbiont of Ixodes persulcatus]|nr:multidrug efflux SMR transporter [Rickettsia endosymbiont of Ixodes persulcatus]MCZ6903787.1 multidrug efflux SMR transporter [Rickettsia endosymbiont of Ixodes persulcatus]MCZ6909118.1 multidrug efflux SMR transporter [Rickettsia endosymbiont of Ixodes persulcatus]MCZ6911102.1 multidrug efflux SMR transporter [Rickettsia endosymbiont of Ixodes persulcatus]MCZ6914170.1 multidrug efflux SMR transporter [Rickettsia endosymbiont of Ixodes persulcatus]
MYWLLLIIAGLFEIAFAISLKYSDGLTKLKPTLLFIFFGALSFTCLAKTLNKIPIGTAYAVWTGIGAAGTAILGIFIFNEPISILRLFFITTLIISIIGLKFS